MGPWAHDKGTNEKLSRTLETVIQASELMTQQWMPPTQLTAHATDPASPMWRRILDGSCRRPKVPDNVLGIKLGHKLLAEASRPQLSACVL